MPPRQPKSPFYRILLIGGALMALIFGYWFGNQLTKPDLQGLSATVLPTPRPLGAFELIDHNGERFTAANLAGHWSFVFFGYTRCPDVCPTTMLLFNQVYNRLADEPQIRDATRWLLVSVDPERDTPELLRSYVTYYNPSFIGVTGPPGEIEKLASQMSVVYMKQPLEGGDDYLVDHSSAILLLDPQGRLFAIFSGAQDAATLAADFKKLARNFR